MRVICIAGLPDISPNQRIDVGKLLEIRNEPEAIEFRGWLADVEKLSDAELKERVSSLNTKIGLLIQRTPGKVLRLLATSVIGVANPVAGFVASTLDYFAWDKFFRRSGAAAFVNELYPSIFVANRDSNAR